MSKCDSCSLSSHALAPPPFFPSFTLSPFLLAFSLSLPLSILLSLPHHLLIGCRFLVFGRDNSTAFDLVLPLGSLGVPKTHHLVPFSLRTLLFCDKLQAFSHFASSTRKNPNPYDLQPWWLNLPAFFHHHDLLFSLANCFTPLRIWTTSRFSIRLIVTVEPLRDHHGLPRVWRALAQVREPSRCSRFPSTRPTVNPYRVGGSPPPSQKPSPSNASFHLNTNGLASIGKTKMPRTDYCPTSRVPLRLPLTTRTLAVSLPCALPRDTV